MDKIELGKRLKEARKLNGLTQEKLAEKSGIGTMYLGEIERGEKMPSLKIFIRLLEALNVSADYILRNELTSGKEYVYDEITKKLEALTPKQRKAANDILDAFIRNIDTESESVD